MMRYSSKKHTTHTSRGFTLIEMIVSVAIFSTVVLIAIGALLSIIAANRKANSLRVVMENLNFAVESIARDVRTGDGYECGGTGGDCSGADDISFEDQNGNAVTYYLSGNTILRTTATGTITMTSPSVVIEDVNFSVEGSDAGDGIQPRVLMTIQGYAGEDDRTRSAFSIQTSISQRDTDS